MPAARFRLTRALDDEARLGRHRPVKSGDDQERRPAFELGVARLDLDSGACRLST